jgi:hypothetical protein
MTPKTTIRPIADTPIKIKKAPKIRLSTVAKNPLPELVKIPQINKINTKPMKKRINIGQSPYVWAKQKR